MARDSLGREIDRGESERDSRRGKRRGKGETDRSRDSLGRETDG